MKLINLTPHPVTFVTEDGAVILELPGCPNPPRAQEARETHGEVRGVLSVVKHIPTLVSTIFKKEVSL